MNKINFNKCKLVFNIALLTALLGFNYQVSAHVATPIQGQNSQKPTAPCNGTNTDVCCAPGVGGKVTLYTGSEHLRRTDLTVNSVYPIELVREYDSATDFDSALGFGWAFKHDFRLYEFSDTHIEVRHGCGNIDQFVLTGGAYQAQAGNLGGSLVKTLSGDFELTFNDGSQHVYDQQGRLTEIFDDRGNRHEYLYTLNKLPLTGTSPYAVDKSEPITVAYMFQVTRVQERLADGQLSGVFIDFTYDSTTGRVSSATSSDGRSVSYQHDESQNGLTEGNLIQVNGLENFVSTYLYDDKVNNVFQDRHNLTSYVHGTGTTPRLLTYDNQDRVIREDYGFDRYDFDWSQYLIETRVTHTTRDDNGSNPKVAISRYEFTDVGFISLVENALGHQTQYGLDAFGNILKEEYFDGSVETGILVKTINYGVYDSNSNPSSKSITLSSDETITTSWTYDGSILSSEQTVSSLEPTKIFKTEWIYNHDIQGNVTTLQEKRNYKDNGTDYSRTSYTYNANGDVLTMTLEDDHVVVNEYGAAFGGRYVTKRYHQINGAAVSDLQETYNYDARGNLIAVTDAKNNTTNTEYDDVNRPVKITNQLGHIANLTYDNNLNLTHIISDRSVINDQLDIIKTSYNNEKRPVKIERTDEVGAFVVIESKSYNSEGLLLSSSNILGQTSNYVYDLIGQLKSLTNFKNESIHLSLDIFGNVTHQEIRNSTGTVVNYSDASFDELDRQLTQVNATNNQTSRISYDAISNVISATDALNRPSTISSYNTLGQLTAVQDANSKSSQYSYHDRGWLETVTDRNNHTTTYNYNELGQLSSLVSPDTGTSTRTYDLSGNRASSTDARNRQTDYVYDSLDRLETVTYPTASKNVSLSYDQGTNGLGQITSMTDESGSSSYIYNHWGDLVTETKIINGQSFTLRYNYDNLNRLVNMTYPSGRVVSFTYDSNSEITGIDTDYQSSSQNLLSNITYIPFGGIDQATFGNGLAFNQDYDLDYRLIRQQVGTIYDRSMTYSDVNNIKNITNNTDNTKTQNFSYDNLDRLTDANGDYGTFKYGYDDNSNRTSEIKNGTLTSNYNYQTASNRLNDIAGSKSDTYNYDNNGNTSNKNGIAFAYDDTNRMSQAITGGSIANYKYDGAGQRVVKQIGLTTTIYIFNQYGKLIAEADGNGSILKEYIYLGSQPLAIVAYQTTANIYYYHNDHLGTPQLLTDQVQGIVWRGDYEPFGEVNVPTNTVDNPLRFAGQYFDQETNLHYNYFRDYDPKTGRYVESDPIGLGGGLNTFSYVGGNPIGRIDPLGLWGFSSGSSASATGALGYGVSAGANQQSFSDGTSANYFTGGQVYGVDLGVDAEVNVAVHFGSGTAGADSWKGNFTEVNLSLFYGTATVFWAFDKNGDGWLGASVGGATEGFGFSVSDVTYIPTQSSYNSDSYRNSVPDTSHLYPLFKNENFQNKPKDYSYSPDLPKDLGPQVLPQCY
jgi:RHS repeat-associated protein